MSVLFQSVKIDKVITAAVGVNRARNEFICSFNTCLFSRASDGLGGLLDARDKMGRQRHISPRPVNESNKKVEKILIMCQICEFI